MVLCSICEAFEFVFIFSADSFKGVVTLFQNLIVSAVRKNVHILIN